MRTCSGHDRRMAFRTAQRPLVSLTICHSSSGQSLEQSSEVIFSFSGPAPRGTLHADASISGSISAESAGSNSRGGSRPALSPVPLSPSPSRAPSIDNGGRGLAGGVPPPGRRPPTPGTPGGDDGGEIGKAFYGSMNFAQVSFI